MIKTFSKLNDSSIPSTYQYQLRHQCSHDHIACYTFIFKVNK